MKYNILTVFAFLILTFSGAWAQEDLSLSHFMRLNPHQLLTNPTADLLCNGYVSIPSIGYANISLYNNALNYNNMFERNEEGYPTTFTVNEFLNSLDPEKNAINTDICIESFGFGLRIKKNFFISFSHNTRLNTELSFSKDLPGFLLLGNMAYLGDGNEADIQLGFNGMAYQEYSFGFQHKVNDHWTWSVRPKLLFGAFNMQTQNMHFIAHTAPDDYTLSVNYEAQALITSCMPFDINLKDGLYEFNFGKYSKRVIGDAFRNVGASIDLGLKYSPSPKFDISIAALDLGFIQWKTNSVLIENYSSNAENLPARGPFQFAGFTNEDYDLIDSKVGILTLLDSVADYFPFSSTPTNAYTTMLHTRLQAQFDYTIIPSCRLSLLATGRLYNKTFHPAVTIAYNGTFFNMLDVCVAYTLQERCYSNLALGLGVNLGPVNLFLATQNILPVFNHTWLNKVNASAGIAINWGYAKHKKEAIEKKSVNAAVPASQH